MSKPGMQYRPLGRCGMKVSAFSLGGWTTFGDSVTDQSTVRTMLCEAFECGVNFFDIADVYNKGETEKAMGTVLKEFPRHELVISSKVFFPMSDEVNDRGLSRKHIMESVDKSLQRIGTDYLDIYFCHRFDENTPIEETARAMDDLIHRGKILYWGTSDWTGSQIREAIRICNAKNLCRPQVEQPRYNLLARGRVENDVRPVTVEHGMGLVTFSPLAYGILSGKYTDGLPEGSRLDRHEWLRGRYYQEDVLRRVTMMEELADSLGCTCAQLALAWLVQQPGVSSVITGATRLEQVRENLGALPVHIGNDVQAELERLFPVDNE